VAEHVRHRSPEEYVVETSDRDRGGTPLASAVPETGSGEPLGEHAPALLAAEHWSLIAARSLVWNEAQSRATVFLTLLSAAIVALALLADATGFGTGTTTAALVLLPVVFLLGIAAYVRLVQINVEEFQLVLAMNRLRHGYLDLEPGLARYLTASAHDDERGVFATYMVDGPTRRAAWLHFLVNTPSIVATVNSALATAIVVLGLRAARAPSAAAVAGGVAAFLLVWGLLFWLQRLTLRPLQALKPRFPTPPERP
jgi:hypothetical protein